MLYKVSDNVDTIFGNDINQFADALTGNADAGLIKFFAQIAAPGAPSATVNTTAGNLTGAYQYAVVFVTGYWKGQVGTGTLEVTGNTGYGAISATVSPSSQQVNLTNIPVGPTGTVARIIARTKAGGNTFYQVFQINDNTTTTYTDNTTDASLGAQLSQTNTTGTFLNLPNYTTLPPILPANTLCLCNGQLYLSNGATWTTMTSSNATASAPGLVEAAAVPAAGAPVANIRVASAQEMELTTTNATTVLTYTPSSNGGFEIDLYFRVTNAATNVTIATSWQSVSGNQSDSVNYGTVSIGDHGLPARIINAIAGTPIQVQVTAGTANQVYVSGDIIAK